MQKVINNIKNTDLEQSVYIIYYNSVCRDLFINDDSFELYDVDNDRKTDIYIFNKENINVL
jgi:hypothetical protein